MLFWLRPCRRGGSPRHVADSVAVTVGSGPSSPVRVGGCGLGKLLALSKPQSPPSVTQVQQGLPWTSEQLSHRSGAEVLQSQKWCGGPSMIGLTGFITLHPV